MRVLSACPGQVSRLVSTSAVKGVLSKGGAVPPRPFRQPPQADCTRGILCGLSVMRYCRPWTFSVLLIATFPAPPPRVTRPMSARFWS